MPYIDKTGVRSGWALFSSPGMGLIDWVEEAPADPPPTPTATPEQIKAALAGLGMTADQLDALFAAAAKLQA